MNFHLHYANIFGTWASFFLLIDLKDFFFRFRVGVGGDWSFSELF